MEPRISITLIIVSGAFLMFSIIWRMRKPTKNASRMVIIAVVLLAFSFMQWASWYK